MFNVNKKKKFIKKLLKHSNFVSKIYIFMSTKTAGDDYDGYEANYTFSNLNPIIIKGFVRELTAESAYYKQYGLHQSGVREILCDERFREAFENCNKIEIDSIEFQVFKDGPKTSIIKRPNKTIRVTVSRKD